VDASEVDVDVDGSNINCAPPCWEITLIPAGNAQAEPIFEYVSGGVSGSAAGCITDPQGAACTLIGETVKIIVLTEKVTVQGIYDGSTGSLPILQSFLDLPDTDGNAIYDGKPVNDVIFASLMSFYVVHELFHTMSTPENMGAERKLIGKLVSRNQ
jgi:hypothetical protein